MHAANIVTGIFSHFPKMRIEKLSLRDVSECFAGGKRAKSTKCSIQQCKSMSPVPWAQIRVSDSSKIKEYISEITQSHCNVCISSGTLQNRSLTDIIRKEDLVVSENLTTLLVFVPRSVACLLTFCVTPYDLFLCLFILKGWILFFWFVEGATLTGKAPMNVWHTL